MRIEGPPPLTVALLQVWVPGGDRARPTGQGKDVGTGDAETRGRISAVEGTSLHPVAGHLRIEFDKASGIYVQTLTDPRTDEILRQFPNASQLEFARAARAYVRSQLDNG